MQPITCSKCARQLEFLGDPRAMFDPIASVLGSSATFRAMEQWRGNVCVDCRLILCPTCITIGAATPCPQCKLPTKPALRVYVEQVLAPPASVPTEPRAPEASGSNYAQLVRRLKELLIAANKWGERNGYPLYEEYPQYKEVQEIGRKLNDAGGIGLMRKAYGEVEGHIPYPGMSEYWWEGIGSWWP